MIWYIDFIILKNNSNKILTKIKKIRFILLRRVIKIHVLVSIKELYLIKSWFCPLFVTILNIICTYGYFNTIQYCRNMSVPEIKNFDNIPVVHFSCFYDVTVIGNFPPFLKIMKKLSGFFYIHNKKVHSAMLLQTTFTYDYHCWSKLRMHSMFPL